MQDISVPNVIPKALLDVICRLESDELQFTWKLSRNKEGFSLSVNQVKVPAKRDSRDPGKTTVDVEAKPLKKSQEKVSFNSCTRSCQTQALSEEESSFKSCFSPT